MTKLEKEIKRLVRYATVHLGGRKFTYALRYYHNRGRWPDLENPQDMSEILLKKILAKEFGNYAKYADKISVRDYVKAKGLEDCLLKHYRYWHAAEDVSMEQLPEKFVLKTNNGAGGHDIFVCRDKSKFNLQKVKRKLAVALKKKYDLEYQYSKIVPTIICEELIETEDGSLPWDYKFTCIYGEPQDCMVGIGRDDGSVKISRRNMDWSLKDCTVKSSQSEIEPEKPSQFDEMVRIARILSADFDFVRVDLYQWKEKVYFGELTFSPAGGILGTYTDDAIKEYGEIYRKHQQI